MANLQPTFNWNGITGISSYEFAMTDQTTRQTVTAMVNGSSWTPSQPLILNQNYIWWVGAVGAGNTIAWDSPLAFSIQLVPTGPSGAIANVMPAFTWNAVTGVSSYEVAVWDQNAGKTVTAIVSNASWTPSQPLNIEDSYEWWVGPIGANNKITWDSPLTFTIPLAGIGPSGIIAALQPSFTWNSLTGVSSYRFLLLNQTTNVTVANTVVSGTTWTPSQALTPGDQYEWWVEVAGRQRRRLGQSACVHDRADGHRAQRRHHHRAADLHMEPGDGSEQLSALARRSKHQLGRRISAGQRHLVDAEPASQRGRSLLLAGRGHGQRHQPDRLEQPAGLHDRSDGHQPQWARLHADADVHLEQHHRRDQL